VLIINLCSQIRAADVYGDSEDLLGKWFAANPEKRKDIFLATKFANKVLPDGTREVDSTPEYAKACCDKSLKRLGIDCIDLYYCHRLDKKTPIENTVRAMAELKAEGKIKYLGLSECSADSLRRASKITHISAVQMEYSPFALEIESEQTNLLKVARELGVAIVAYSPIGRGMFSGTMRSPDDFAEVRRTNRSLKYELITFREISGGSHLVSRRRTFPRILNWLTSLSLWQRRRTALLHS
jgi:aryl-alcohol dehydrogenase-like predicted oxidoreductase